MKTLFGLLFLIVSASSFAETCFKADEKPSEQSQLPQVVCVQDYSFGLIVLPLPRHPYLGATAVTSLGQNSVSVNLRHSQKPPFKVSVPFTVNEIDYGTCLYKYRSQVLVEFMIDAAANVISDSLEVVAEEEENRDDCHLEGSVKTLSYSRI